jgi:CubicO group peptidase (beta-lactamase class C family)
VLILGISVTAESLPKAIPEKVGLSSKRLERVSELFQDLVDQQQLAGVVALVARQGKVAFFKAWGRMDLADDVPMGKDTIFRIASMTKPITCTAVMILHEEGRQVQAPGLPVAHRMKGFHTVSIGSFFE